MAKADRTSNTAVIDALNLKLGHLEAQMTMTCGDARESFANLSEDLQDKYLHSVLESIADVRELASKLSRDAASV